MIEIKNQEAKDVSIAVKTDIDLAIVLNLKKKSQEEEEELVLIVEKKDIE